MTVTFLDIFTYFRIHLRNAQSPKKSTPANIVDPDQTFVCLWVSLCYFPKNGTEQLVDARKETNRGERGTKRMTMQKRSNTNMPLFPTMCMYNPYHPITPEIVEGSS